MPPRVVHVTPPDAIAEGVEAIRVARNILNQPAFDKYNDGELSPGTDVQTDEQILDWVTSTTFDGLAGRAG